MGLEVLKGGMGIKAGHKHLLYGVVAAGFRQ
jgi:hypothetical protein